MMPHRETGNNDLSATVLRSKLMPCNVDGADNCLHNSCVEQASIVRNA